MTDIKFIGAMCCYGILAVLAGVTLDGKIRVATWIFLGGIALKTILALLKRRLD